MAQKGLRAVHDDDLEAVLKGLGVFGDFQRGSLSCAICHSPITWDNLHALLPDSGSIKCVCDRPECANGVLGRIQQRPRR